VGMGFTNHESPVANHEITFGPHPPPSLPLEGGGIWKLPPFQGRAGVRMEYADGIRTQLAVLPLKGEEP